MGKTPNETSENIIAELIKAKLESNTEQTPEEPKEKPKQPRKEFDCFDCPYLKDVGRAYYCMFFKIMNCPKGYGVPSIWEYYRTGRKPKETREEERIKSFVLVRRPFPDPIPRKTEAKTANQMITDMYHREIYEWYYEQGWTWREIGDHLGCKKSYVQTYVSRCNRYWGWSWTDVVVNAPPEKPEEKE